MSRDAAHVPPAARASYPLREGNAVVPLVDGDHAFRRIGQAIERARHSAWLTVAFIDREAPLPDGRGSLFDVLDRAARRGIDVRVLFWREPRLAELDPGSTHFGGTAEERAWLRSRGSRFLARWDRQEGGFCHHQKSFLIDAGESSEVAFVGGVDPTRQSLAPAGRRARPAGGAHAVYLEIAGPAAADVHHNFVQRWNEASERDRQDGCWPGPAEAGDLDHPRFLPRPAGSVPVQITRTVASGRYRRETAAVGHKPYPIGHGEQSVLEQYVSAVAAAERTLYLENLAIASPVIVDEIEQALSRGVRVAFVVPGRAHPAFVAARRSPRSAPFFARLAALGRFEGFTLASLGASRGEGHYDEVYVHARLAIVDDAFATIGSANVAERSFRHDTELNAGFWHAPTARALRERLFEHALGRPVADLPAADAFALFRDTVLRNRDRRTLWQPLEGLAYAIDPADYGA